MVSFTMYWLIREKKNLCFNLSEKKKNLTGSGWFINHFLNVFFNCTKKHWPHKHRHVGVKEAHLLINKHRFFINVPLFKFGLCSVEKQTFNSCQIVKNITAKHIYIYKEKQLHHIPVLEDTLTVN